MLSFISRVFHAPSPTHLPIPRLHSEFPRPAARRRQTIRHTAPESSPSATHEREPAPARGEGRQALTWAGSHLRASQPPGATGQWNREHHRAADCLDKIDRSTAVSEPVA